LIRYSLPKVHKTSLSPLELSEIVRFLGVSITDGGSIHGVNIYSGEVIADRFGEEKLGKVKV